MLGAELGWGCEGVRVPGQPPPWHHPHWDCELGHAWSTPKGCGISDPVLSRQEQKLRVRQFWHQEEKDGVVRRFPAEDSEGALSLEFKSSDSHPGSPLLPPPSTWGISHDWASGSSNVNEQNFYLPGLPWELNKVIYWHHDKSLHCLSSTVCQGLC